MKATLRRIWHWCDPPHGNGARDVLALLTLAQGLGRAITGSFATPVNLLPSRAYGALLILAAGGLLATRNCKRLTRAGRAVAIATFALWFLIGLDVLGAWVSFAGVCVLALVAFNEARADVC